MKKRKIASAALSMMLVGSVVKPVFADLIVADGDMLKVDNQNSVDIYVEEGQPWSTKIDVSIIDKKDQNHKAAFPVLGSITPKEAGLDLSQNTFSVAGYDSKASVIVSSKEAKEFTYHVNFQANADETGLTGNGADQVTINVHVLPKADTTAPVFNEIGDVTVEATGDKTMVNLDKPTTEDPTAVITNNAPADGFNYGDTTVTWTAKDAAGNTSTATQIVHVVDTTKPVLTIPNDIIKEATAKFTDVKIGEATATDAFGVEVTNNAPDVFPYGDTVVKWTATDAHGNVTIAQQIVKITDTTKPVFTYVPDNKIVEATAVNSTVDVGTATATDIFNLEVTNNAPATFGLGTKEVKWLATDEHGNVNEATQKITVVDTTAPEITNLEDKTVVLTGDKTQVNLGNVTATDIFDTMLTNDAPADGFPVGTTTVTWTAIDTSGNKTVVKQKVTVGYTWAGFLQPINADGTSVFKQGSTVPVKFQIKNAAGQLVNNAIANISVQKIAGDVIGETNEAVSTGAATTGTLFRYEDSSYIYNLNTKSLTSNSKYRITVTLNDGTSHSVTIGLK